MTRTITSSIIGFFMLCIASAQNVISPTPPMGFTTWGLFQDRFTEADLTSVVDAMVSTGLQDAGYNYIIIDDAWQSGRDNKNNIVADPKKFPSGIKTFCDYAHSKGIKVGIYSGANTLTCAGHTGSLYFEEQDAKTFAEWGIDYLKYGYCGASEDAEAAKILYSKMSEALKEHNSKIILDVYEWGDRSPWLWASDYGQLWRTAPDIKDKWSSGSEASSQKDLHKLGAGILDIVNINAELQEYAGPDHWNNPGILVTGLYGKKGPTSDLGGLGCTDVEYRSQMSLWSLMASPLMVSCDIRAMNEATKSILLNKDVIAINQDELGKQASREIKNSNWQVFVKYLSNTDVAIGILNLSNKKQTININLSDVGITAKSKAFDLWEKSTTDIEDGIRVDVESHETKLYRLSR